MELCLYCFLRSMSSVDAWYSQSLQLGESLVKEEDRLEWSGRRNMVSAKLDVRAKVVTGTPLFGRELQL